MAPTKMSTILAFVFMCTFAGLSYGSQQCSTNEVEWVTNVMECVMKEHPEYLFTVLTRIKNPASMENADFMCNHKGIMSAAFECALKFSERCTPSSVASNFVSTLSSKNVVANMISFVCAHRNECVMKQLPTLATCVVSKLYPLTQQAGSGTNMEEALCAHHDVVSDIGTCMLDYVHACVPSSSQVSSIMPTRDTITHAMTFFCSHQQELNDPCVKKNMPSFLSCVGSKMHSLSQLHTANPRTTQESFCLALRTEEQCLSASLSDCPPKTSSSLVAALLAFFPTNSCHIRVTDNKNVLVFQSERHG